MECPNGEYAGEIRTPGDVLSTGRIELAEVTGMTSALPALTQWRTRPAPRDTAARLRLIGSAHVRSRPGRPAPNAVAVQRAGACRPVLAVQPRVQPSSWSPVEGGGVRVGDVPCYGGRHAELKLPCLLACGFESHRGHQLFASKSNKNRCQDLLLRQRVRPP